MTTMTKAPELVDLSFGLLSGQQAIWLADRASKDPAAFLSADVTTLPPGVDPELFARACGLAVQRTEALRLRLSGLSSQFVAASRPDELTIPFIDLTAEPYPEAACSDWLDAALRVPLDPATAAPFAWSLLRVAPDRWAWGQIAHHAVLDATGRHLVAERVAELYDALANNVALPDAPEAPGLANLVEAEAGYLNSSLYGDNAGWCLAQCQDPPLASSLSGRSGGVSLLGRRASQAVDPMQADALRKVAAQCGGSLAHLLCAAWAALLARLCGQSDLLIGYQVAARRPAARRIPAMLTNQMPLRLTLPQGAEFADLVALTGRQCRSALRHQHYPTLHLRRVLGLTPADPNPLDISFNFLPRFPEVTIGGQPLVTRNLSHGPVRDLMLAVQEDADGGLLLELDVNRDRYAADEAQRLVGRMALMLRALSAQSGHVAPIRTADLPIMPAAEQHLVEAAFCIGDAPPPPATLAALLAEAAAETPDATALQVGSLQLSYRELHARADRLGLHLQSHGLEAGSVVAVALPRNEALIVTIVACVLIGVAVCPLDPAHPPNRRAHMLAASHARFVLGLAGAEEAPDGPPMLAIDTPTVEVPATCEPVTCELVTCDTIAFVAFTSGSTGRPKGVAVTQAAVVQQVRALRKHLPLSVGDTVLCATTLTFDVAMADVFLALASGATLHLLREQEMRDPAAIRDAALTHSSPLLQATPSVWRSLPIEGLPPSLRAVIGGEAFPVDLLPRLRRLRGVFNVYGPTETTVWATLHRIANDHDAAQPVPVGRPLDGYRVWILDPDGRPTPIGGSGELCIGGPSVAMGYLDEAELTHAAFVAVPAFVGTEDGDGRMYRTGDLARWRDDGAIELLGRRDGQVKIAGHRIELNEIDRVLLDLPSIAEAATLAHSEPVKRLIAYVVPKTTAATPTLAFVRSALAQRLPPWMLPSDLIVLDAMPHTSSGKIDRRALLPPDPTASRANPLSASPQEALLRQAFARVTRRPNVAADEDFFSIGGDSLAAMILLAELSQAGIEVPLPVLLEQRTPAAIAAALALPTAPSQSLANQASVFLIPGIGGDNPDLARFRAEFAASVRFVLLDYPDWPVLLAPGYTMADMIADFAGRVRLAAPSGPVLLAGYSLGGVVAVATASALRDARQNVAGVLLFDLRMIGPGLPFQHRSQAQRAMRVIGAMMRDFLDGDAARTFGALISRRLARRPAVLRRLIGLRATRLPARWRYWVRYQLSVELQAKIVEPWRHSGLSNAMRLTGVHTILFRASNVVSAAGSDPGWCKQGVGVRVVDVTGDHYSMLRQRGAGSLCQLVGPVVSELLADRAPAGAADVEQQTEVAIAVTRRGDIAALTP